MENKKIYMFTGAILILIAFSLIFFFGNIFAPDEEISKEKICTSNNGTWVEDANECEYISKEICEENDGEFFECESACRNDPEAQICTLQCVQVCKFTQE